MYDIMKEDGHFNALCGPGSARASLSVSRAAEIPQGYKTILLASSKNSYEEAVPSSSRSSHRLPGTYRFLDVVSLHTQRPIVLGESGTPVLDPEDGLWYGHIIAAEDDSNIAYVLPAIGILNSIAQTLGVPQESLAFTAESLTELSHNLRFDSDFSNSHPALQPGEVRMLKLVPITENRGEPLLATFEHVYLEDRPTFTALSYAWSREAPSDMIRIDGKPFAITPDLAAAFQILRSNIQTDLVWVDAVCINRENQVELATQVPKMDDIFRQAQEVVVWLGSNDDETNHAVDLLLRLSRARWEPAYYRTSRVSILHHIFDRLWFHRIWMAQEVVLARKVTVFCGPRKIPWNLMKIFASFWSSHVRLSIEAGEPEKMHHLHSRLSIDARTSSHRELDLGILLFPGTAPLADLLQASKSFKCSDPRDRVFALLGMTTEATDIEIDYHKSTTEVYVEAISHVIRHQKSLDIICQPWIPQQDRLQIETQLPSWIPQWRPTIPFADRTEHFVKGSTALRSAVLRGDREVVQLLLSQRHFRATGHFSAHFDLEPANIFGQSGTIAGPFGIVRNSSRFGKTSHMMQCSGQVVATLIESTNWSSRLFDHSSLESIESDKGSDEYASYWRTLFADGDINDRRPAPLWYGEALEDLRELQRSDYWDWHSPIDSMHGQSPLSALAKRMASVMANRQLMTFSLQAGETQARMLKKSNPTMMALVPEEGREGDYISLIFGCSVPVVLRRVHDANEGQGLSSEKEDGKGLACRLIGECFVYGMMDGEMLSTPAPPATNFKIV